MLQVGQIYLVIYVIFFMFCCLNILNLKLCAIHALNIVDLGEFTRHVYMYTRAWQGYLFKGYLIIHP